jgi:hypothetical protein
LLGSAQGEPDASPSVDREAAANVLYGDPAINHRDSLREVETAALQSLATPEQAAAMASQVAPVLGQYAASDQHAKGYTAAIAQVIRQPATAEQAAEWAQQSKQWLRDEFGDDAGRVLEDVRRMVKADPKLAKHLQSTRLGDHPAAARLLATAAIARRKAGRL